MGVFKIAKAEFIKIFKRPSVYLMGIVLAIVLVFSMMFFQPIGRDNITVSLDGANINSMVTSFYDTTSTLNPEVKKDTYDTVINNSIAQADFYINLQTRSENLETAVKEFNTLFLELVGHLGAKDTALTQTAFDAIELKLNEINTIYNDTASLVVSSTFKAFTELNYTTTHDKMDIISFVDGNNYISDMQALRTTYDSSAQDYVNIINNSEDLTIFNKIVDTNKTFVTSILNIYTSEINSYQTEYIQKVFNSTTPTYNTYITKYINPLKTLIDGFNTLLITLEAEDYSTVLINKAIIEDAKEASVEAQNVIATLLDSKNTSTEREKHEACAAGLNDLKFSGTVNDFKNNVLEVNYSKKVFQDVKIVLTTELNKQTTLTLKKIDELNSSEPTSDNTVHINELTSYITDYKAISIYANTIIDSVTKLELLNGISYFDINKYLHYDNFNTYEALEELNIANNAILSGEFGHNYLDVFSFNKQSGNTTNAYDFIYFGMEIAGFVITIFAIFMAASLIASEYDNGTIKLLAIRPFKRWKIIWGKMFATLFFVLTFILFSFTVCLIMGFAQYPALNQMVLAVFNSGTVFTISPLALSLLHVLSIVLEIVFYMVIAISISTIFRSYISAISISAILFLIAQSFNLLFGSQLWYAYFPFGNTDIFKYFGGSNLVQSTDAISNFFNSTMLLNSNFFITISIYLATMVVFIVTTQSIFKHRDF